MRGAGPADRASLSLLLARTWRRYGGASLDDQIELLHNGLSTVSLSHGDVNGFFGLHLRAPAGPDAEIWADLNLVALEANGRTDGSLPAMTRAAVPALERAGALGIVNLTPPGWLQ
ncbi:MAG: hypothetical protein ACM30E_08395, partial [Nitrososphaerales archaeon]